MVRGPYPGFPNETSRCPSAAGSRAPSPTPATSPT